MGSQGEWTREKREITETEFNQLKASAKKVIIRENYLLEDGNPRLTINRYLGDYKGLTFVEAEFDNQEDGDMFEPLSWMGTEITNCPLGRDAWILSLDREHFLKILDTENDKSNPEPQSYV